MWTYTGIKYVLMFSLLIVNVVTTSNSEYC